jgi:hypothetical protein
MWTHVIQVQSPSLDLNSGVLDVEEPMLVQAFQSEPAVEGFAVGVFRRFARSRKVDLDAGEISRTSPAVVWGLRS